MDKTLLEKLQEAERKKYSMMRQFSVFFTSSQTVNAEEMKKSLRVLKELAEGFLSVIGSQLNAFDEDIFQEICEKLNEEKIILANMVAKINRIDRHNFYEDRDEIDLIHAEVESFNVKAKEVSSLAQTSGLRVRVKK